MRKCRLRRLVLAATVIGVAGLLSLPAFTDGDANGNDTAISQVDWTNADETYPVPDGSPTEGPSYDGDGTSDPDDQDGSGGDGDGPGPSGEGASPSSGPKDSGSGRGGSGGLLDLPFPVQAGLSVGLLALAFLALLPGRKMPADLR